MNKQVLRVALQRAKRGDQEAHKQVALAVYERYSSRMARFLSKDPALDKDDLMQTFFEGIWRAVVIADGRGDDFYHIGQRGYWAVQSEIRTIKQMLTHRAKYLPQHLKDLGYDDESVTAGNMDGFEDPELEFATLVHDRMDCEGRVRVIVNSNLGPQVERMVEVAMGIDPATTDYNGEIARQLGVSPQRVSQLMGKVRQATAEAA